MSFRTKLTSAFAAVTAVVLGLSALSLWLTEKTDSEMTVLVASSARKVELAGALRTRLADLLASQRGILLYGRSSDAGAAASAKQQFEKQPALLRATAAEYRGLITTDEGRRLAAEFLSKLSEWESQAPSLLEMAGSGKSQEALVFGGTKLEPLLDSLTRTVETMHALQEKLLAQESEEAHQRGNAARVAIFVLVALVLVASGAGVAVIRRSGYSITAASSLIRDGAERVSLAAGQVASASQALAQGANEQAASLEETSASTEEINSMTRKNAENTASAADEMKRVDVIVTNMRDKLSEMVRSMAEINTSSDKISKIIRVIDEIAFQTNILALNAAVEAARAGEAGMGFAVVADEVRGLAQRCAQAARDTSGLIEESIAKVSDGVQRLDAVNAAMKDNIEISGRVKTLVDEVNLGSQEQSRGMEQISKAVTQMEQVTQKNAAAAEQSASASEELTSLAGNMKDAIRNLERELGASGVEPAGLRKRGPGLVKRATAPEPKSAPSAKPSCRLVSKPMGAKPVAPLPSRPNREEIPLEPALLDFREIH